MKIGYIISHGVAEWVDKDCSNTDELMLSFKPKCCGALVIGTAVYPVNNGEVSIPKGALRDGEHHPRLECPDGVIRVSPILKSGRDVMPKESSGETVRRLIKNCYILEERLAQAEKALAKLEKMCKGHNIFNFERKEI